ncbi:hypothetical protein [Noviherbaspirillum humi]|nr:hypothetical protein [Noviherbaspirillum humi]
MAARMGWGIVAALALPLLPSCGGSGDSAAASQAAVQPARTPAGWQITDLGTLNGAELALAAFNDAGDVVGSVQLPGGVTHAFLYKNGRTTDLGTLGGSYSAATGVNRAGHIFGNSAGTDGARQAFILKERNMEPVALPFPVALSVARGINDDGDLLIEYVKRPNDDPERRCTSIPGCVLIIRQNETIDLGNTFYQAVAMNNAGQVVGTQFSRNQKTLIWNKGAVTDIGLLPGPAAPFSTVPLAMNNKGEVVGYSSSPPRPYLYSQGAIADAAARLGADIASLNGINDGGGLIGAYRSGEGDSAFLYRDGKLIDLNGLAEVKQAGWSRLSATAINNAGQVIGYGINRDGMRRAFLLTPPK